MKSFQNSYCGIETMHKSKSLHIVAVKHYIDIIKEGQENVFITSNMFKVLQRTEWPIEDTTPLWERESEKILGWYI